MSATTISFPTPRRPGLFAWATVGAVVALSPVVYLLIRSWEAGPERIANEVFTARVAGLATTSIALAGVVTVASVVVGGLAAFLVTRTRVPARRALTVALALPLAVPSYVAAFAWIGAGDLLPGSPRAEGFWVAALVMTLHTYPYVFLPTTAALRGVDPAYEESAASLGLSPRAVAWQVTAPLARPALLAGGALAALYTLSDFGAVSLLRVDTFTRAVFTSFSVGFDRTGAVALSTVLLVLTCLVLMPVFSFRSRQVTRTSTSRDLDTKTRSQSGSVLGLAFIGLVLVPALGVPALALARWFTAGVSRPGALGELVSVSLTSLGVAAAGALVTVVLAFPLGILVGRYPTRAVRFMERAVYITHSLPGVVIGLSLVFIGLAVVPALYQSVWLLAVAYAALFLPLAIGSIATCAAQAPREIDDVAASLGVRPAATVARVLVPLTMPGVGAAAGLVVLSAMKELPATLMLRPTGMETLATRLWTHTTVDSYAAAAPYAALIVVLSAFPAWLVVSRSGALGGGDSA